VSRLRVWLVLIVVISACLAGCAKQAKGPVEIVYWTGWSGHEFEVQKKLVDQFNKTHPHIHVKILSVFGSYQKVTIAFAGNDTPDVLSAVWADQLAGYAMRGAVTPLDDYMKRSGRNLDEWVPGVQRMLQYKGRTYALAATTNSSFIVYNKDIFREAGVKQVPRTIAELDAAAWKCTKYDSHGRFVRYGFRPGWLMVWAYVFGGSWYDPETNTVTANHPRNVEALRWIQSYSKKYDIRKMQGFESGFGSTESVNGPFFARKIAMWHTGEWADRFIKRYAKDLRWGYFSLPYPPGGRPNALTIGGSVFVIPSACKHKEEAWEFLNYICGPQAVSDFCYGIGNMAPLKAVIATPRFQRDPLLRFAGELQSGENAFGPPQMVVWPTYVNEIARAEELAIYGGGDPKKLLDKVQETMKRELADAMEGR
jgi:multiple sugar transport system substrate-binding protein